MAEPDFLSATRASYDAVAAEYAELFRTELESMPLERAMLAGFAELVRAADAGPVADVGSGPGRVTAHLHALGLRVFGVDLSPQMVALARREHPGLRFDQGSMTDLDVPDGALGGIVAMYSTVHIPQEELPQVFAEFHRALAPDGRLLLVFQVGDESEHLAEAFGRTISLDYHSRRPDRIAELLTEAGLAVDAQLLREPGESERHQRACLLARKPPGT